MGSENKNGKVRLHMGLVMLDVISAGCLSVIF